MRLTFLSSVSALVLLGMLPSTARSAFEFVAPTPVTAPAQRADDAGTMPIIPDAVIESAPLPMAMDPVSSSGGASSSSASALVQSALNPVMKTSADDVTISPDYPLTDPDNPVLVEAPKRVPMTPVSNDRDALTIGNAAPAGITAEIQELPPLPPVRNTSYDTAVAPPVPLLPVSPAMPDPVMASASASAPVPSMHVPASVMPSSPAAQGDVVHGFGRDVPLVLALQQIVPTSYRYSFDKGINPGMRISWSGDRPWKDVITEIARHNNMNVDIVSNVVAFHRGSPTPSMAPMMPVPPSPVAVAAAQDGALLPPLPLMDQVDPPQAMPLPIPQATPVRSQPVEQDLLLPPSVASVPPLPQPVAKKRVAIAGTTTATGNVVNEQRLMSLISDSAEDRRVYGAGSGYAASRAIAPLAVAAPSMDVGFAYDQAVAVPSPTVTSEPLMPSMPRETLATTISPSQTHNSAAVPLIPDMDVHPAAQPAQAAKQVPVQKAPAFDPVMDVDQPARGRVEDKQILTADADMAVMTAVSAPEVPSSFDIPMPIMPSALPDVPAFEPAGSTHVLPRSSSMPVMKETPAVVSPPMYVPTDMTTAREWSAFKGETLRQALTKWSGDAGVSLVWSSEYDYPLQTDVRIETTYAEAVRTLLAGFSKAQPRPLGRLFDNKESGAQPVLIVETQRLTN